MKPLPPGKYRLFCKEKSSMAAAMNGHSIIWPEADAESDGELVVFFKDGKQVYSCNATYAAFNFVAERIA